MTYTNLRAAFETIKSVCTKEEASRIIDIIDGAAENANETVHVEFAAPVSEWDNIFRRTVEEALAYSDARTVVEWFAEQGYTA